MDKLKIKKIINIATLILLLCTILFSSIAAGTTNSDVPAENVKTAFLLVFISSILTLVFFSVSNITSDTSEKTAAKILCRIFLLTTTLLSFFFASVVQSLFHIIAVLNLILFFITVGFELYSAGYFTLSGQKNDTETQNDSVLSYVKKNPSEDAKEVANTQPTKETKQSVVKNLETEKVTLTKNVEQPGCSYEKVNYQVNYELSYKAKILCNIAAIIGVVFASFVLLYNFITMIVYLKALNNFPKLSSNSSFAGALAIEIFIVLLLTIAIFLNTNQIHKINNTTNKKLLISSIIYNFSLIALFVFLSIIFVFAFPEALNIMLVNILGLEIPLIATNVLYLVVLLGKNKTDIEKDDCKSIDSLENNLAKIKSLFDKSLITKEEYNKLKEKEINKLI